MVRSDRRGFLIAGTGALVAGAAGAQTARTSDFGAVGVTDRSTPPDSTVALQRAIRAIESGRTGLALDLEGRAYGISAPLVATRGDFELRNGTLRALPGFRADETGSRAMIRMSNGLRRLAYDLHLDCAGVADGIHIEDAGFASRYERIRIDNFRENGFGILVDGASDQHLVALEVTQHHDPARRTGIGIWIRAGDAKLVSCVSRYAARPLLVEANTLNCTACHFYNGVPGGEGMLDTVNVEIRHGSGQAFVGCYVDKGTILLKRFDNQWIGTQLLFHTEAQHLSVLRLDCGDRRDVPWPPRFVFQGAQSTLALERGGLAFVALEASGGGSWSAAARRTAARINGSRGVPTIHDGGAMTVCRGAWTVLDAGQGRVMLEANESGLMPGGDARQGLGAPNRRWRELHVARGAVSTSDAGEKQLMDGFSAAELAVARRLVARTRRFRWREDVAGQGNAAPIQLGLTAQDVAASFEAEGLDPVHYGVLSIEEAVPGVRHLGLRYDQLLQWQMVGMLALRE
ncbi:MAG: hypothetical protein AAFR52_05060 [Pseudomonadota bacterium]